MHPSKPSEITQEQYSIEPSCQDLEIAKGVKVLITGLEILIINNLIN